MNNHFKVLVLEDDETSFKLIDTTLYFLDVQTLHAETGEQGFEILKKNKVDMILLDLNLPDMDGFTFIEKFKTLKQNIPVVAQTAYAINNEKSRCFEAGCVDFLLKPLSVNKLQKIIAQYKK